MLSPSLHGFADIAVVSDGALVPASACRWDAGGWDLEVLLGKLLTESNSQAIPYLDLSDDLPHSQNILRQIKERCCATVDDPARLDTLSAKAEPVAFDLPDGQVEISNTAPDQPVASKSILFIAIITWMLSLLLHCQNLAVLFRVLSSADCFSLMEWDRFSSCFLQTLTVRDEGMQAAEAFFRPSTVGQQVPNVVDMVLQSVADASSFLGGPQDAERVKSLRGNVALVGGVCTMPGIHLRPSLGPLSCMLPFSSEQDAEILS